MAKGKFYFKLLRIPLNTEIYEIFLHSNEKSDLVTDPVQGIFTLTQVLDQFLGLQETRALLLGPHQQKVP